MSGWGLDGVWKMSELCLEGVGRVSGGRSLKGVWRVLDVLKVSGGCLE